MARYPVHYHMDKQGVMHTHRVGGVTAESLWRQHKVFGRIPSKWAIWARNLAWLAMGINGTVTAICMFVLDTRNPFNTVAFAGFWLPSIWGFLTWYVWHTKRRLEKVIAVMQVLDSVTGGD